MIREIVKTQFYTHPDRNKPDFPFCLIMGEVAKNPSDIEGIDAELVDYAVAYYDAQADDDKKAMEKLKAQTKGLLEL